MHAFKREQCNACRLSVLKPMSCLKKQHCLHSHICLIHASNAMPFNDNILSGWKVCVCTQARTNVCDVVRCMCACVLNECEIERKKRRGRRREKNISKVRSSRRPKGRDTWDRDSLASAPQQSTLYVCVCLLWGLHFLWHPTMREKVDGWIDRWMDR